MQTIVEGNPGSGKSFFFVNYLLKYCQYDLLYREYVLREDVIIISNVDGLRIKHLNLDEMLKKYTVEEFFTVANFEKIQKQYRVKNIILGIDEAQKIFDNKFFNKDVFYLFQYHRHLGLDIFLITQSRSTLCRQLLPLCEYFVNAKPRSKGVKGTFSYHYLDPKGNYMYSKTLKASSEVFRAYKSFTADEMNKPKNILMHYLILGVVVLGVVFGLFKYTFSWFNVRAEASQAKPKAAASHVDSGNKPVKPMLLYSSGQRQGQASFNPVSSVRSPIPAVSPVKASASGWLPLDMVYKDGSKILISIKGYKGVYKLPCESIAKVDIPNKRCIPSDPSALIPM